MPIKFIKMEDNLYIDSLNKLSSVLGKSSLVNSFDKDDEKESYNLAVSLLDIKESIKNLNKLIDQIHLEKDEDKIDKSLWDIGDEFRHIIYHISNSRFYDYIDIVK